jgi:hypothetical protein
MGKQKTEELTETLENFGDGELKLEKLYNHKIANWSGKTHQGQFYTDRIAEWLLDNKDSFNEALQGVTSQRDSYIVEAHDGVTNKQTNREEEIFAKALLGHPVSQLGRIIDYQVPLKAKESDSYGKIDLVSINKDKPAAYLIELKMVDKGETLLRAALEIETYSQILNDNTFRDYLATKIGDESRYEGHSLNEVETKGIPIKKAALFAVTESVDEKNKTHLPKEFREKNKGKYQNVRELVGENEFGIDIFLIERTYPVTKKWN